jgi:hypothetical protein
MSLGKRACSSFVIGRGVNAQTAGVLIGQVLGLEVERSKFLLEVVEA